MTTTFRIVVGVDGSEGGERALHWAVREAARRGATVRAVTAWTWAGVDAATVSGPEEARRHVEDMLGKAIVAELNNDPRVPVSTEIVHGPAGPALVDAARGADLLVLGRHGHGRIFHAVVGSVAEHCIREAPCPVVVLPVPREAPVEPVPTGMPAGIL